MRLSTAITPADDVVSAARALAGRDLTVSSLGNVSVRQRDHVWITPSRVLPANLDPADVAVLGMDGVRSSEGAPASRELPMHLAIYHRYRGIGAIVHTHSPWATAWSHEYRDLDMPTEELEYHQIRRIRCSPHAPAGSAALGECAANALADAPAALLGGHGVVAVGPDLDTAVSYAALTEQQAHIAWLRRLEALADAPPDRRPGSSRDAASQDRVRRFLGPRSTGNAGDLLP
jgi:L-fuculose-phosphate aldolase